MKYVVPALMVLLLLSALFGVPLLLVGVGVLFLAGVELYTVYLNPKLHVRLGAVLSPTIKVVTVLAILFSFWFGVLVVSGKKFEGGDPKGFLRYSEPLLKIPLLGPLYSRIPAILPYRDLHELVLTYTYRYYESVDVTRHESEYNDQIGLAGELCRPLYDRYRRDSTDPIACWSSMLLREIYSQRARTFFQQSAFDSMITIDSELAARDSALLGSQMKFPTDEQFHLWILQRPSVMKARFGSAQDRARRELLTIYRGMGDSTPKLIQGRLEHNISNTLWTQYHDSIPKERRAAILDSARKFSELAITHFNEANAPYYRLRSLYTHAQVCLGAFHSDTSRIHLEKAKVDLTEMSAAAQQFGNQYAYGEAQEMFGQYHFMAATHMLEPWHLDSAIVTLRSLRLTPAASTYPLIREDARRQLSRSLQERARRNNDSADIVEAFSLLGASLRERPVFADGILTDVRRITKMVPYSDSLTTPSETKYRDELCATIENVASKTRSLHSNSQTWKKMRDDLVRTTDSVSSIWCQPQVSPERK